MSDSGLTACAEFAASAASGCQPEAALKLWSAACAPVVSCAAESSDRSCREAASATSDVQRRCLIAAAVVAAVPRGAVQLPHGSSPGADNGISAGSPPNVADALLQLALLQGGEPSPAVHALAAAAAAVLNKAPTGTLRKRLSISKSAKMWVKQRSSASPAAQSCSLHLCISASVYLLSVFLYPCISVGLYPSVAVSLLNCTTRLSASLHLLSVSLYLYVCIPVSVYLYLF